MKLEESCLLHAENYFTQLEAGNWRRDERRRYIVEKSIQNDIYDIKNNFSGKLSVKARDDWKAGKLPKQKMTKEHFYPRMATARKIVSQYEEGKIKKPEDLVPILLETSKYHLVTKEENNNLRKYQVSDELKGSSWEKHYEAAGIKLVDMADECHHRNRVDISVDGVIYSGRLEAAITFGISVSTVDDRCRSRNFPNWTKIKRTGN